MSVAELRGRVTSGVKQGDAVRRQSDDQSLTGKWRDIQTGFSFLGDVQGWRGKQLNVGSQPGRWSAIHGWSISSGGRRVRCKDTPGRRAWIQANTFEIVVPHTTSKGHSGIKISSWLTWPGRVTSVWQQSLWGPWHKGAHLQWVAWSTGGNFTPVVACWGAYFQPLKEARWHGIYKANPSGSCMVWQVILSANE